MNLPASQDERFSTFHKARQSQHQGFENQPSFGLPSDARDDLKQFQDIGGHVDLKPSPCGGVNLSRLTARGRSRGGRLGGGCLGACHAQILAQDAMSLQGDAFALQSDPCNGFSTYVLPVLPRGTICKPQSTTAPEVGSRRPKGHEQSAFGIVAPGRARVARRRPAGRRRAPRPRPAPLPRPPPVRALARPAHQAPLAALRLAPHQFAARIEGDRGGAILD